MSLPGRRERGKTRQSINTHHSLMNARVTPAHDEGIRVSTKTVLLNLEAYPSSSPD